jgi:hypothetical protein
VICLTLPDDLSRVEPPEETRAFVRPRAMSFGLYAFGPAFVRLVTDLSWLARDVTADGLDWLDQQLSEIDRFRAAEGGVPLVLFAFHPPDSRVLATVARHPDLSLIAPSPPEDDERHFIRGDGHPNADGNRFFAQRLANVVTAQALP